MDRNREARKSTMAASANGMSRRRQRSNSLRDSPEEDVPMELQETARLRDRGVKKDRDRDRSSRSKRRRGDRLIGGEESSEESVNDDEEDDYDDERGGGGGGGAVRMFPPPNPAASISTSLSNHHYVNRKSFPPSATAKVIRPAAPGWKPADEMIGFTVPRKARSASGKRSQECSISGSGVGADQINGQTSTSPPGLTRSPAPASPPSSSNASVPKKMKPNGSKPRPPKSTSKPSANPEELEIEIAEVLYGMMTQSQNPSKKEITARESASFDVRDMNKSRTSSPIPNNTTQLLQNSSSSAVALKRKRARQASDSLDNFSVRHSLVSSTTVTKTEVDLPPKTEISSPNMGSAAENGTVPLDFASSQVGQPPSEPPPPDSGRPETGYESRNVGLAKEETVTSPKKEAPMVRADNDRDVAAVIKAESTISEIESQREEKCEIDLMAPPPLMNSSLEPDGGINFGTAMEQKPAKDKQDGKAVITGKEEAMNVEPEQKKAKLAAEEDELKKPVVNEERNIDLQFDWGKVERDVSLSGNKLNPHVKSQQQQQQPKAIKDEPLQMEKTAQSSSLPLPMSVSSWPGGPPPMGYMAPLQGVVSMDGNTVSPPPIQPLVSHPRPKRCSTHCFIAQNIHYLQMFLKMKQFLPHGATSSASVFGAKPSNLNVMPSAESQGNNAGKILNSMQEKGQELSIFPSHSGKEKGSQANNIADAQRKQQPIPLQQALPRGASSNMLHGAFVFPFNQQQAHAAAASSVRPGSVKPPTAAANVASTNASSSGSVSGSTTAPSAASAVSFNYPNMPPSETQYLAILQNKPYPFPIPSGGAPPTYRGTHAQAMPFFNGSFYSSQMIHPSQLQQPQQPSVQQQNTSSGSSSSQKHLHGQQQQQQRPQSSSGNNLHSFPASKKANQQAPTAEVGSEDSPSTAESRVSRPSFYSQNFGQNFAAVPMPIHTQNFALMAPSPPSALGGAAGCGVNQGEKKQQGSKVAGHESMNPQAFAMSFASMNGVDMSSVVQNYAVLQSFPEANRHRNQMIAAAAAAHAAQQKNHLRVPEEGKTGVSGDSSNNVDEEKKSSTLKPTSTAGHHSIVFSRPDLQDSVSVAPLRDLRSSTSNAMGSATTPPSSQLQAQLQYQQQMMQLHKHHQQQQQQQQQLAAAAAVGNMTPQTSNGSVYNDHLVSSVKFPNGMSNLPQNLVRNNNSSPSQPPQWKNSTKTTTSQVPSSSLAPSTKNLPKQQTRTEHNQTQISFGATQKSTTAAPQGQQAPSSHQAQSPPGAVGSPTTSSISKGAGGSPRTTTTTSAANKSAQPSSLLSQPPKNSASAPSRKSSPVGSRNVSSILGKTHMTSLPNTSAKLQMQQQQQQQQQLFFSHGYMPAQGPHSTGANSAAASAASGFYLQRWRSEQPQQSQQPPQGSSATPSSTGMLSLSSPFTVSNASTSVAKAAAASTTSGFHLQRRYSEQPQQSQPSPQGSSATSSSTGLLSLCSPVTLTKASTSDTKAVPASTTSGYYLQRRRVEQPQQSQQPPQGSSATSSSGGMFSLCSTVTVSNANASDAKAVTATPNMKGGGLSSQGILHSAVPPGFSFVHAVPSPVQVKPAEQKQPAA